MRLRFAPSPTGFLHIGNLRTALYNFIISKKYNAEFILRIEDTDMERSSRESENSILRDLRWAGLEWKEGPDIGGPCGPYRQSERFDIYREYTEKLLRSGDAYHCYCTQEELEEMRTENEAGEKTYVYNGRCKNLSDAERKRFQDEGRKPSVRFRVPEDETIVIEDLIKGRVAFDSENIGGDFIIVRSDGVPVYNYLVVIDDALMKITHVIRGEDHLSNTPKQIAIYKALGFSLPQFAHHSLVLGPDRSKLSKRHGMTSVEMYRREGYLPEALVNYLAILGWAAEGGEEILPFNEIIRQIDIATLSKTPGVFDFQKLKWMNGNYIREYDLKKITGLFITYIEDAGYDLKDVNRNWLEDVIAILRLNCDVLSDIKNSIGLFLSDVIEPDSEADALLREDNSRKIITEAKRLVGSEINEENFHSDLVKKIGENTSIKGKNLFMPVRAMLTGRLKGPIMDKAMPLFGFEKCRKRIEFIYKKYVGI